MKHLYFLLLICIFPLILCAQGNRMCYDPPSLDFGGTKISFKYLITDSIISQTSCQGVDYDKDRGYMWLKPLEYENTYIISMGTVSGTMIWAMDKKTNTRLWRKQYNHVNDPDMRAIGVAFFKKLGGDSLELLTNRSFYVWDGANLPQAGLSGYPGRRIINYKTGETLNDYWIGDTLNIVGADFNKFRFFNGFVGNDQPQKIHNADMYYSFNLFSDDASDSRTLQWGHIYTDSKTLIKYTQHPPFNELEGLAVPNLNFNFRGVNNSRPFGGYEYFGPIIINDTTNQYLLRYYLDGVFRTSKILIDDWGRLLEESDITENINNGIDGFAWYNNFSAIGNNTIRLNGGIRNKEEFFEIGHHGYVEIDYEGNMITDRKALSFDGLRPLLLASTEIRNRNSKLHVFRPQENNDLYLYEEFADGSYRRAGHLINPNRSLFAFSPDNVWSMENGDIFINFHVRLDSIIDGNNFDRGGWNGLLKIESVDLGLIVGTTESNTMSSKLKISPNPTNSIIHIQGLQEEAKVNIQDINGQVIKTVTTTDGQVDISELPNGLYIFEIQNKQVIERHKVLKIE